MLADRLGQCGDDDEIAFCCGADQRIGGKPLDDHSTRWRRADTASSRRTHSAAPYR